MRQFKFKIWCKGTSDNANFNKPGWWRISSYLINRYYPIDHVLDTPESEFWKHFEICQFTGLNDKNGKEIFEGDVVKINNLQCSFKNGEPEFDWRVFEVKYNRFTWAITNSVYYAPLSDYNLNTLEPYDIEVIGNIYENKELLNE